MMLLHIVIDAGSKKHNRITTHYCKDESMYGHYYNLVIVVGVVEEVDRPLAHRFWKCISTQVRLPDGQIRVEQMWSNM